MDRRKMGFYFWVEEAHSGQRLTSQAWSGPVDLIQSRMVELACTQNTGVFR